MSASALLRAVEARLRAVLGDTDGKLVRIMPGDGKPPAGCGQVFYSVVWPGSASEDVNPLSHDVVHPVTVTITARAAVHPLDRRGTKAVDAGGVIALADRVADRGVIHGYDLLMAEANALIPGTAEYAAANGGGVTTNGFCEELVLLDYGPVVERGGEWVGAEPGGEGVLSCDVRFGKARRVQVL